MHAATSEGACNRHKTVHATTSDDQRVHACSNIDRASVNFDLDLPLEPPLPQTSLSLFFFLFCCVCITCSDMVSTLNAWGCYLTVGRSLWLVGRALWLCGEVHSHHAFGFSSWLRRFPSCGLGIQGRQGCEEPHRGGRQVD